MRDYFDLKGKVIVITGATGVLGEHITRALSAAEAKVVIIARQQDRIDALVQSLLDKGAAATGISADVLDKDALTVAAQTVMDTYGRVDILINGAGGNRPDATTLPGERAFFDLPQEALDWVFKLNFMGTILTSQVFAPIMVQQQRGVILNISSMAANKPLTRVVAYSAAKAALNNFTQWFAIYMATEHSPNIRVNALAPGFYLGQQNRYLLIDETSGNLTARGQQIIDHTPMQRFGDPDDLVGTVIWLVTDASRFITGIIVPVDGGFMAYSGV